VPVERIIEARRRLLPQLIGYREFLDSLTPDFVAISAIRDPEVRAAKLRNHVESRIGQPVETMERTLGRLGLQPVRAVLSLQTLAPPTALACWRTLFTCLRWSAARVWSRGASWGRCTARSTSAGRSSPAIPPDTC
jgi:hypothetical protein